MERFRTMRLKPGVPYPCVRLGRESPACLGVTSWLRLWAQRPPPLIGHAAVVAAAANEHDRGGSRMKVHLTPPSPRAIKVLAVVHHLGLEPEIAFVDLLGGAQLKPEFAA